MRKLFTKLINELERFDNLNEEDQISTLKHLKKIFPRISFLVRNEELKWLKTL